MLSGSADSHDVLCTKVCVCAYVCVWSEFAASAGREHDKVGVLLRGLQAAVRERREVGT